MSIQEVKNVDQAISLTLCSGAIEKCQDEDGQFISTVFTVPKSSGGVRFVINLKKLNEYISAPHFKMEDIRSAVNLISQNSYLAVIDQRDAYHKIPVAKVSRKFLKFRWKSQLYQFTCIPFGLNVAPWLFTKLMKPVMSSLRKLGLLSVSYLDDCLLIGNTYEECDKNVKQTCALFNKLGLEVNEKKSQKIPLTEVRYLGLIINSSKMSIQIPKEREVKVIKICKALMNASNSTIHDLSVLIGNLVACIPAVPYCRLYMKQLEYEKVTALKLNKFKYDAKMSLSSKALEDLQWWIDNLPSASKCFHEKPFDLTINTDASLVAYGACSNGRRVTGLWSAYQKNLHINVLELLAIYYALLALKLERDQRILLRVDNTTAIAYVNNYGGMGNYQCHEVAKAIWQWCEARRIYIKATYIASKLNTEADHLSRLDMTDQSDFSLGHSYYQSICNELFYPEVDLFATHLTAKCKNYVSWKSDPGASEIDAFTIPWREKFYAFPPFNLVGKVLNKIENDNVYGILIVPNWPTQAWFPLFIRMCNFKFKILRPSSKLLFCPYSGRKHSLSTKVELLAGLVSSTHLEQSGSQKTY